MQQLKLVEANKEKFDVVTVVRGGGSQTDFKPFNDYDLSKYVASFPIPILTGIGHDRNTSIVDLMARQHKTPTKVAAFIVEHNFNFENDILNVKERFFEGAATLIKNAKDDLSELKRVVISSSPATILKKGFAIVTINDRIVTDPKVIKAKTELKTIMKNEIIHSTVTQKTKNVNELDI